MSSIAGRYSSGIADLDRLLDGGFSRGSFVLLHVDETVGPTDLESFLTPTLLNFLYQSMGVIAVLPSRESPAKFRQHLTRWVSRRRFDTRVRVIDYVGEGSDAPYVVNLSAKRPQPETRKGQGAARSKEMEKMAAAEAAVRGARGRMFLELVSLEIQEMLFGPELAVRMFFHGTKRVRMVGNLCIGILRPGLQCADAVRGMADVELEVHRNELGLVLRGLRPTFPGHLVVDDARWGPPHLSFVPAP